METVATRALMPQPKGATGCGHTGMGEGGVNVYSNFLKNLETWTFMRNSLVLHVGST